MENSQAINSREREREKRWRQMESLLGTHRLTYYNYVEKHL